ncbi:hypothetical protein ILUMI_00262 [Ignelater luminosus]|uniref:Retrotransposon gag domain-containing protein n=1 Tax=Ignelater luminosus TaxID=2038154 RepID=A0A8K0DLZ1_IGNLU|nr:hypothetical protein ILUMI_00262 [Ignelater luminosus]
MDIDRLSVDELDYELTIRGIDCQANVGDERKLLRARIRIEPMLLSVHLTFFERIDELRTARGVSDSNLFNTAIELFRGDALIWYRSIRDTVNSWAELVRELLKAFLPCDCEQNIWEEVRHRSQGDHESVSVYIAVMENLFRRLPSIPIELTRRDIIRRNLLPYLHSQPAFEGTTTICRLTQLCKAIEDAHIRASKFKAPPTDFRPALESDFVYR